MHSITIRVCEKTSNVQALEAVQQFISANLIDDDYLYARDVEIYGCGKMTVVEAAPKNGEMTCEANFMVSVNETQP